MSAFQTVKLWLLDGSGLAKDALHIYVGLTVFIGSAALLRWRIGGWKPLALAAAVALAGEAWDIADRTAAGSAQRCQGNLHDLWNTLLWPLVLWALARWTRVLSR